jgi:hypothetical protein
MNSNGNGQGNGQGGGTGNGQGQGNGQGGGMGNGMIGANGRGPGNFNGGIAALVRNMPLEDVSQEEEKGLMRMREEEKLARDVYLSIATMWNIPLYSNIAKSEQRHMDAIRVLLTRYNLADPVVSDDIGVFSDPKMLQLYNDFINRARLSEKEALLIGAGIEDLDIYDLKALLKDADSQDIAVVYQNLMKGSRNHLRSFIKVLDMYGATYSAQYLTQSEIDDILSSPKENGIVDANGDPFYGQTGW